MKHCIIVLLLAVNATASSSTIVVREPIVHLVRRHDLPRLCGTTARVDACTAFAGQVLRCRCEQAGAEWRVVPAGQFIPVMYVLGPERVHHEREHIEDIERSLSGYLADLEQRRFGSVTACQMEAESVSATFVAMMDEFKRRSNELRHPTVR